MRHSAIALLALCVACGGGDEGTMEDMDTGMASGDSMGTMSAAPAVSIVEPADGDTIDGGTVTVRLDVTGLTIAMAGDTTPGTGHHHLFLDRDVTPAGVAIPAEPGFIVHMGDGSTSHTFENVAPGEHRLIAVMGDGMHIPLQPWVTDTVRFVVR